MKEFWDERYKEEVYAYGQEPNDFLKAQEFGSGLNVLCLAEGEGRNGVYLASLGNDVTCIDYSEAGLEKTKQLALLKGQEVSCFCADLSDVELEPLKWDLIIGVFAHFPPNVKKHIWPQISNALKPGGRLVMEVYDLEQLRFGTGGPQQEALLYSKEELVELLGNAFSSLQIDKVYREVKEGTYHNGASATLQIIAVK